MRGIGSECQPRTRHSHSRNPAACARRVVISAVALPTSRRPMPDPTWISLLPPLLAIALAIGTRQVYLSLAAGVWLGWTVLVRLEPAHRARRRASRRSSPCSAMRATRA